MGRVTIHGSEDVHTSTLEAKLNAGIGGFLVKYRVRLEKTDEGYAVWCPGLPGCWSQGATEEEALENITDAIHTYLVTVEELVKDKATCLVEVPVYEATV